VARDKFNERQVRQPAKKKMGNGISIAMPPCMTTLKKDLKDKVKNGEYNQGVEVVETCRKTYTVNDDGDVIPTTKTETG